MTARISIYCLWAVVILGLLNFFAFMAGAAIIGGDALNGGAVRNGHFFIGEKGVSHEVSEAVFTYSRIHAYSVLVTHPLAIFAGIFLVRMAKRRPR